MRPLAMMLSAMLATAPVLAGSARAEVAQKSETGFVVGAEEDLPDKSPPDVWQMLLTPAKWWNPLHSWSGDAANLTLDPQAGGCFCEKLPPPKDGAEDLHPGSIEHMRVIAVMPPKILRMSGALGPLQGEALTGTLTVVLKPLAGGGTHLTWGYVVGGYMRQKPAEIVPLVDKVLTEQFIRLSDAVPASSPPPPGKNAPDEGGR